MKRRGLRAAVYGACAGVGILVINVAMIFHLDWSSFYIMGLFIAWAMSTNVTRLR